MPILPKDHHCCGCAACFNACAYASIKMVRDDEGFYTPIVDESTCTECKACETACPTLPFLNFAPYDTVRKVSQFPLMLCVEMIGGGALQKKYSKNTHSSSHTTPSFRFNKDLKKQNSLTFSPKLTRFIEPQCFALKAKKDDLRLDSSSGGAFSLLSEYVLKLGGVVFGAAFDEKLNVVHRFIESAEQIGLLRKSKYVESNIGESYKQALQFLKKGRLVLFSGVQCQIHALNSFLRKPYENLISVEVICNSVPSSKVWDIYKESLEQELGEKLLEFNFRGKNFGWENYCLIATTHTKQKIIPNNQTPYLYHCWNTHTITRKSCANCYSKGFVSGADITLGDFWGIRAWHADFVDEKGISCVMTHNQKALDLIKSLQDECILQMTHSSIVVSANPALVHSNPLHKNRESILKKFFAIYHKSKNAKKAIAFLASQRNLDKTSLLHHYYQVYKDDPLRRAISNSFKNLKKSFQSKLMRKNK